MERSLERCWAKPLRCNTEHRSVSHTHLRSEDNNETKTIKQQCACCRNLGEGEDRRRNHHSGHGQVKTTRGEGRSGWSLEMG